MSDYDTKCALSEGYDPEERHQRYPLVPKSEPEHWLIRRARALPFSKYSPLQPILDHMFIGAIKGMGQNPKLYTMDAIAEATAAHSKASAIAEERRLDCAEDGALKGR